MMEYVCLSKGLHQRELIPVGDDLYKTVGSELETDWYSSIFYYTKEHFNQFKQTRKVAGMQGQKTNKIVFDFDSQDTELARQDALTTCVRLKEAGINPKDMRVFYSGGKGFHVIITFDEAFSRQEFINMVFGLAGDLQTFDTTINDFNRILRLPYTKHPKTHCYKIPITTWELKNLTVEQIIEASNEVDKESARDGIKALDYPKIPMPEAIVALKNTTAKKAIKELESKTEIKADFSDIDFTNAPKWLSPDRFALLEGAFLGSDSTDVGERNKANLILCATLKNQGFDRDQVLALLLTTADKQARRTGEEPYTEAQLVNEIISTVFSPSWRGGQFSSDEPLLVKTRERFNLDVEQVEVQTEDINTVGMGFKDYAKNINKNRILLGLKSFDEHIMLSVGSLCTVVSAPGGGKTALGNLFAETVSAEGNDVMYFSLDLFKNLLFGRMLQRYVKLDIKDILYQFESGNPDQELVAAYSEVLAQYNNVFFRFRTASIDDIENDIKKHIQKRGRSPKLVIVDYLDKVRTQYADPTQSSANVAGRLSDIAKQYNTLVLLMAQPSKFGSSGPNEPFKSYRSLKGSSSIESDSRLVIGVHREGYDPADSSRDVFSSLTILKNNAGPLMRLDYKWDGMAGTFEELDSEGKRDLKRLRDDIAASKEETKGSWDI